jgi:hypothetical protein
MFEKVATRHFCELEERHPPRLCLHIIFRTSEKTVPPDLNGYRGKAFFTTLFIENDTIRRFNLPAFSPLSLGAGLRGLTARLRD